MGNDVIQVKLGDVCDFLGGFAFKSEDLNNFGGVPVVKIKNVNNKIVTLEDVQFFPIDKISDKHSKFLLQHGDVLIAMTGQGSVGRVGRFYSNGERVLLNQRVGKFLPKKTIDLGYLYYILSSEQYEQILFNSASGSGQPNLSPDIIKSVLISYVPLAIQKKISYVLTTLDKKITLNRQINQTLEQMAQTLFKSWFVDFDPVIDNALDADNEIPEPLQARAELRQQVRASQDFRSLPADVRALFPAEFEESELGWVPKEWECKDMTQLVDTVSITYPLKSVEKVIFLNTGDIENGRFLHCNYSSVEGLPGQAKKSIQKGDILFSEIRPQNKRFAFVNFDADHHVVSTKLMVLRAKDKIDPLLPYFILTLEKNTDELQRIAELRSGTFPQITYKELEMLGCVLPNNIELLDVFVSSYLKPMYSRNFALTDQNEQLAQLRDTLLPKLISGELRLDEIPSP